MKRHRRNMKLGARTKGKYDSRISDRSDKSCGWAGNSIVFFLIFNFEESLNY
jgi:hypothetical protein